MKSERWNCKELNAYDLMPERNLFTTFITSPKEPDVSTDFSIFKSQRSRSRKMILYKYKPPLVRPQKIMKASGPRFNNELPEATSIELVRTKASQKSLSKSPVNEAEAFIEEIIRNRKDLSLPTIEKPKSSYKNIKERFIKAKSELDQQRQGRCETLLQTIKDSIKNINYNIENEMNYWDKQPIRKWNVRPNHIVMQTKFQSPNKNNDFNNFEEDEFVKNRINHIDELLENCGKEILNWET